MTLGGILGDGFKRHRAGAVRNLKLENARITRTSKTPKTQQEPMLNTLKNLLTSLISPDADASPAALEHRLQLATAVLMVEVMRADPTMHAAERDATLAALLG